MLKVLTCVIDGAAVMKGAKKGVAKQIMEACYSSIIMLVGKSVCTL